MRYCQRSLSINEAAEEIKAYALESNVVTGPLMTANASIYWEQNLSVGVIAIRDVIEEDIDGFVDYWHFSGEKHLNFLGIDRNKLGTPGETRGRFLRSIRTPGVYQQAVAFSITLNSHLIGYTNINLYNRYENYPHLHLNAALIRTAVLAPNTNSLSKRGGLATTLVAHILKNNFYLFDIDRIVLQTRTRNALINRALSAYMPVMETRYVECPDGLAGPGEFHVRHVVRTDMPRILERSRALQGRRDE